MSTANNVNVVINNNKKESLLDYLKVEKPELRTFFVKKLIKENKLNNFELDPTQLISILSLFVTLERYSVFNDLIPLLAYPELTELKNFKLKPAQLKAILLMFTDSDRFKALNCLKKTFNIEIHLTPLDIEGLKTCLTRSPDFNKLLPLNKKKIWNSFFVKDQQRPNTQPIPHKIVTINANKQKNPRCIMPFSTRQRENGICSRKVGATREAGNALHSKFVIKTDKNSLVKFVGDAKPNDSHPIKRTNFLNKRAEIFKQRNSFNSNNPSQKEDIKKSLGLLISKIRQCQPRGRFDFFINCVKAQKLVIVFENAQAFYNFIKEFLSHDAIKLLDLPYIKDQIKNLQQQGSHLSVKEHTDLLNYIDEKLLKPISPKVKSEVPDLILSCKR